MLELPNTIISFNPFTQNPEYMETSVNNTPSFDSLPKIVAGLCDRLEAIDHKLDLLIAVPQEHADQHVMLDIKEASELIGKTIGTIYSLTSQTAIPYSKRGNKLYFFKDELLAWIKAGGKADIDFRNDDNNEAFERHLAKLRGQKNRTASGFGK